jgi:hypothetical protein
VTHLTVTSSPFYYSIINHQLEQRAGFTPATAFAKGFADLFIFALTTLHKTQNPPCLSLAEAGFFSY